MAGERATEKRVARARLELLKPNERRKTSVFTPTIADSGSGRAGTGPTRDREETPVNFTAESQHSDVKRRVVCISSPSTKGLYDTLIGKKDPRSSASSPG